MTRRELSQDELAALTTRRLTPTERLHEVTMAAMLRRPAAPESSVTISRNAKGVAQFEVTVRAEEIDRAYIDATDTFDNLCDRYPYPVTNGGETT